MLDRRHLEGKGKESFTLTSLAKLLPKQGELLSTDYLFSGRNQAQMPLGHQFARGIMKVSQERKASFCLNGFLYEASMTCSATAARNHSYHVALWIKMLKSHHNS